MSRLEIMTPDKSQQVVEGLYRDLERRIVASPPGLCPIDMSASFLKMCRAQTCGKCVPCRVGLVQLELMLEAILDNHGDMAMIGELEHTAQVIAESSDCAIGYEAASMVLKSVRGCREDFIEHIRNHRCSSALSQPVPCVSLCPAGVDVPGYTALVHAGKYADAVRLIRKDNPFPTSCAFICEHPCEIRCRRNMIDGAINIRAIKRYAVDHAGTVPPPSRSASTGKKVAVVGGGPGGLTAAYYLSLMGHHVTVMEKQSHLGGMLRYGIPSYRLPRERLQDDIDAIIATGGIQVRTSADINDSDDFIRLTSEYDAVYLAIGAHSDRKLGLPGEDSIGVVSAVEMLRHIGNGDMPDFTGKRVIVVGGGNVAMDAARSSVRLGASTVSIVYRRRQVDMTALPEEVEGAIGEGCEVLSLYAPVRVEASKEGIVTALWVKPQIVGKIDSSGRPRPVDSQEPEKAVPCDIIIVAIGQNVEYRGFEDAGVPVSRGTIHASSSSKVENIPSIPNLFAGGDCVSGPATVIKAIAAGKAAAANIDNFLGFNHEISVDVDIPLPTLDDRTPCGRVNLTEREAHERAHDFAQIECGMTCQEADQESGRCLRCDHFGFGIFKGGRIAKW
ncbi:NAD(P)-binding protein [Parasphaerochaeta coccoides]|uniref:Glutamate synthase (NADPH) n=1 Tax=Parasphaerochaeta coccoides (strain ATCC BAA-1237 / DSM 17374 / SPN1) TaxID=760011 RepID=F4GHP7_PARC1|nr:NAD(P)-binding protein [Parasphaerochaeta coccoides]AEC01585.1 Glutamate synthase (NADPH) [Parasphaerochaeta coccoides DSM 17374]